MRRRRDLATTVVLLAMCGGTARAEEPTVSLFAAPANSEAVVVHVSDAGGTRAGALHQRVMASAAHASVQPASTATSSSASRSWVRRHPVWTGTIIGVAGGTAAAHNAWGAEGAFVGFWGGAGAGALVGWLLSR